MHKPTPIPKKKALVLFLITVADGISMSFYNSFIALMITNQYGVSSENVGFYAGLITSAFYLGQLLSNYPLGWISDHKGRKPILILGLFTNAVCQLSFGFSSYLWVAIVVRFINGLFNANVPTVKCYVREISDITNQAKMYSIRTIGYALGGVIGPIIGGVLAEPADGGLIDFDWDFMMEYPYFLSCALAASFNLIMCIQALVFLPESLQKETHAEEIDLERFACNESGSDSDDRSLDYIVIPESSIQETELNLQEDSLLTPKPSGRIFTQEICVCVLLYALSGMFITMTMQIILVWAPQSTEHFGLGLSATMFGVVSASAVSPIIFQYFMFARLDKLLGSTFSYRSALCLFFPVIFLLPFITTVDNRVLIGVLLFFGNSAVVTLASWSYASVNMMISNAAPPGS
mmetsp:Transcript_5485/g.6685  ORF Transcript_5485/g.6685 Transcript_5485/m.6685 type:complete len:405 (-) Transcript_5485:258-1472(-)